MQSTTKYSVIAAFSLILTACGGGGGSGGGSLSYSGVTTPAILDGASARPITETAVTGSSTGDTFALGTAPPANASGSRLRLVDLAKTLISSAREIDATAGNREVVPGISIAHSHRQNGACGGHLDYGISYDDATGHFSGSLQFQGFDNCHGEVVNGEAGFSGTLDVVNLALLRFGYSFANLTVTADSASNSLSGTIEIVDTGLFAYTVTYNLMFRDTAGDTYRLENYVVAIDESGGPTQVEITGRVYHPHYGYVTVATITPLRIYSYNSYPHAGIIRLEGEIGAAGGTTSVTVAFTGLNSFTLDIDADGDGSADESYGCNWVPRTCAVL